MWGTIMGCTESKQENEMQESVSRMTTQEPCDNLEAGTQETTLLVLVRANGDFYQDSGKREKKMDLRDISEEK